MPPLCPLADLTAHEEQLLAGLRVLVGQEQPQVGELLPVVAGHLAEQRPFPVHHLVVGQRQHEVLRECVQHAERQRGVVEASMHWIVRHVLEQVVHPAHVPFEAEAEAADVGRARHHRPRGRLFGDGLRGGLGAVHCRVQLAEEIDRGEVLAPAVAIGDPLPGAPRVVEVEHRGDGVHAQPVDVIALDPEQRARQQETSHLVAAVVEDEAAPVRMEPLAGVGVLVEMRPVEVSEAVLVGGEVRRHPVEQNADPLLMQGVDERHEVFGRPVAAGRREVRRRLIAPGRIKRMLHDRQELDVGEAHVAGVGGQPRRDFAVGQQAPRVLGRALPRAEVHFINGHRRLDPLPTAAGRHPLAVLPHVRRRGDDRPGARGYLRLQGVGVGLVDAEPAQPGLDVVFVHRPGSDAGNEPFPDA